MPKLLPLTLAQSKLKFDDFSFVAALGSIQAEVRPMNIYFKRLIRCFLYADLCLQARPAE